MDAPLQTDTTAAAAAVTASTPPPDSVAPPVGQQPQQESSIFSYINNLSPIKPVKAEHDVAGFPGLSSSPGTLPSPPVNLHPEANSLERSENNKLHSGDLLELEVSREKSNICSNESGSRDTQKSNSLIDCEEDPSNNPSGGSHEYLTDTVKVDSENLTPTAGSSLVQSHQAPQSWSDYTGLEETNPQFGDKNKSTEDATSAVEHNIQEQLSFDKMRVETDVIQGLNEMPSDACQQAETSSLVDHSSTEQYYGFTADQEAAQKDEVDIVNQSVHKPSLSSQGCQDNVLTVQPSKISVEGAVFKPVKGQYRRGLHKRCLQFEDAHQSVKARTGSSSLSDIIATSQLPVNPADLDGYNAYGPELEVSNASCRRQLDNLTQPVTSLVSRRNSGTSRSSVSKPLGIGLHLNSIIPIGSGAGGTVMSLEKGSVILPGGNLATVMGSYQPENSHGSVSFTERDTRSASIKDVSNQTQPLVTEGSFASQPTPSGKRKYISGDAVVVKELNQSSPKKKKKKTSTTSNGDGCKRCNCKKTKCLKLYCDCFAAGIYCADTCACQGCFNRPEYEDTVLETRQQIESRNPLAFLPKILRPLTESPAESNMDSGNSATPSSGRHKRGCNCKKSMCLKKYCECYQANVGCSSACRCDGCKNVYGMKEESDKDAISQEHEIYQPAASTEVPEWVGRQDGLVQTELCDHQNFTPQTPAFQFTDRVNGVSRPRFSSGGFSSPETDFQFLQKSPDSTRVADNYDIMSTNAYTDTQGIGYTTDEQTQPNSSSFRAFDYSSLSSSKVADWKTTSSRSQLFPASINSSVYQHCSPITPVTQFGGSKLASRLEFGDKQHEILEDDTPEILKDSYSPINAVKSTSPNKKRVSPPQGHNRLGSSSSVGLKSGRKFILRAVQSFPPLTPCIDSKSRSLSKIETKNAGTTNDDQ